MGISILSYQMLFEHQVKGSLSYPYYLLGFEYLKLSSMRNRTSGWYQSRFIGVNQIRNIYCQSICHNPSKNFNIQKKAQNGSVTFRIRGKADPYQVPEVL